MCSLGATGQCVLEVRPCAYRQFIVSEVSEHSVLHEVEQERKKRPDVTLPNNGAREHI